MNLPNKISLVRIFLVPIFVAIFLLSEFIPYAGLYGAAVFAIASLTDFIDGYIARKYNLVTTLGKYLDSIADKLLVAAGLVLLPIYITPLSSMPIIGTITVAMVIVIIAREFIISALRQAAAAADYVLAADNLGRVKAAVQYVSLIILLPAVAIQQLAGITNNAVIYTGFAVLCVAFVLTIVSAVHYLIKNKNVLSESSLTKS